MKESVVLGYPFSSSVYWLFDSNHRNKSVLEPYNGDHPYYKTLFGKQPNKYINAAASISLLFPNIYLPPADIKYPFKTDKKDNGLYYEKDINVFSNWDWYNSCEKYFEYIPKVLTNQKIQKYLVKCNQNSKEQLIKDAIVEIYMQNKFDAIMYCDRQHKQILKVVSNEIGFQTDVIDSSDLNYELKSMNRLMELSAINFCIKNQDDFFELRLSKDISKYGMNFRKYLANFHENEVKEDLAERMLNTINNDKISKKVIGGLKILTSVSEKIINFAPPQLTSFKPIISITKGVVDVSEKIWDSRMDKCFLLGKAAGEALSLSNLKLTIMNKKKNA